MESSRRILLVLAIAAVVILSDLPCRAAQKDKDEESIWTEDRPRMPRPGERPGERWGRGPRRGWGRPELTEEEIDRIMEGLKQRDPERAKELAELRKEDPERFQAELRRHAREEFGRILRERIEQWRNQRRDEFLQWLEKNYSQEAKELAGLKEQDAKLYLEKFEIISRKYWHIFEEEKRNPELADVLKEDLELKKRRDEILRTIKSAKTDKEKTDLAEDLEEVVSRRFDLIIRRKQIEYERLLKRVEELQKQLEESKAEIAEWRDEQFKDENVKNRVNELLGERSFKWD